MGNVMTICIPQGDMGRQGGAGLPLRYGKKKKRPLGGGASGVVVCGIKHLPAFSNLPGRGDKRQSPPGGSQTYSPPVCGTANPISPTVQ